MTEGNKRMPEPMKLVAGPSRNITVGELEPGEVFEHQGDAWVVVKEEIPTAASMIKVLNFTTWKTSSLHEGTQVSRMKAEMTIT